MILPGVLAELVDRRTCTDTLGGGREALAKIPVNHVVKRARTATAPDSHSWRLSARMLVEGRRPPVSRLSYLLHPLLTAPLRRPALPGMCQLALSSDATSSNKKVPQFGRSW